MTPFLILNVQSTFSLVAFALIGCWYIVPRLSRVGIAEYLQPLVWVHVFRYTPLTLLVPGQVSTDLPGDVASTIAYGDLVCALAALLAVIFLKARWPGAFTIAWLFNIVGIVDLVVSGGAAISARLYEIPIGFNWYIVNFYVPALIVTHAMMVHGLIRARRESVGQPTPA